MRNPLDVAVEMPAPSHEVPIEDAKGLDCPLTSDDEGARAGCTGSNCMWWLPSPTRDGYGSCAMASLARSAWELSRIAEVTARHAFQDADGGSA